MDYSTKIRTYDMEAAERKAIEEAEARWKAHETRRMLEEINATLSRMDDLLVMIAGRMK